MNGATSRAPHSLTDCSSSRCSSFSEKSIMMLACPSVMGSRAAQVATYTTRAKRASYHASTRSSRQTGDGHGRAALEREQRGGAGTVRRDLEMIGAAEQRTHFAGVRVRVGRHHLGNYMAADADVERLTGEPIERAPVNVGHQVAESIDPQHFADNRVAVCLRLRNLEPLNVCSRPSQRTEINAFRDPRRP